MIDHINRCCSPSHPHHHSSLVWLGFISQCCNSLSLSLLLSNPYPSSIYLSFILNSYIYNPTLFRVWVPLSILTPPFNQASFFTLFSLLGFLQILLNVSDLCSHQRPHTLSSQGWIVF
ncbi:hypothetical protein RJT34_18213 [Clitoria ternatea]|uniref:Uncharacterized protein n=1 Tax=Clitoria ternatea TaxID=43366 RepID=A0AAN9PFL3_CLITE